MKCNGLTAIADLHLNFILLEKKPSWIWSCHARFRGAALSSQFAAKFHSCSVRHVPSARTYAQTHTPAWHTSSWVDANWCLRINLSFFPALMRTDMNFTRMQQMFFFFFFFIYTFFPPFNRFLLLYIDYFRLCDIYALTHLRWSYSLGHGCPLSVKVLCLFCPPTHPVLTKLTMSPVVPLYLTFSFIL